MAAGIKLLSYSEIGRLAGVVRNIDLVAVLNLTGAIQDKYDKNKWHTSNGIISVTGPKFRNWTLDTGGGGAIDLVIHLEGLDFKSAVYWLAGHFPVHDSREKINSYSSSKNIFKPPQRDDHKLDWVISYLNIKRCIPKEVINTLVDSETLYADIRANAVFLLLGKERNIIGAELRGTGHTPWRGLAPGTRKDQGYFAIKKPGFNKIILCESAIDAISCFCLHPDCMAVSSSGARSDPEWLKTFLSQDHDVYCGFDSDNTGDRLADRMIQLYPSIKRLQPSMHDWNDMLKDKSRR